MIEEITSWLSLNKVGSRLDALWAMRDVENRLGAPAVGESRLEKIYKWVRLDREEYKIRREKALYEK